MMAAKAIAERPVAGLRQNAGTRPPIRVLYSFPHKLGAGRICTTAWEQVKGLAEAGADVHVFTGAISRPLPPGIKTRTTLAWGRLRVPYRVIGDMRACAVHDYIVAKRLSRMPEQFDIIHAWPLGALRTLEAATRLAIPTVLERPNAHTRFAYEVVQKESERIGVPLPPNHEHAYNAHVLRVEEEEYRRAFRLLCPSEFTADTFLERGFRSEQLVRHFYGVDREIYHPDSRLGNSARPFTALFVGVCAVRKGLHYALDAWLRSPAAQTGQFLIAGEFLPAYEKKLAPLLSHPSVRVLGHRNDVPELMRVSDILLLPTIEEGFGLVCTEAMVSGCVPVVSSACTELCKHMENALVHSVGDVAALAAHITLLHDQRELLEKLRAAGIACAPQITWATAGSKLLDVYRSVLQDHTRREQSHSEETVDR
ncbi:MAG TPA: glycosyltransferase family 4 protein [Vicinamibacterales bacterium]|nr:glycosyltransferase family 4 protein [Vicinamibacterales bacterium]